MSIFKKKTPEQLTFEELERLHLQATATLRYCELMLR
jgi:hypothetical protein